jgi:hypothetical protein
MTNLSTTQSARIQWLAAVFSIPVQRVQHSASESALLPDDPTTVAVHSSEPLLSDGIKQRFTDIGTLQSRHGQDSRQPIGMSKGSAVVRLCPVQTHTRQRTHARLSTSLNAAFRSKTSCGNARKG